MGCLSADSRMLVLNNAVMISPVGFASSAMIEFEQSLSIAKLLRVVTYALRFVFSLKKNPSDPSLAARLHLLKVEQSLYLTKEKLLLLNPSSSDVPFQVAGLNLFFGWERAYSLLR